MHQGGQSYVLCSCQKCLITNEANSQFTGKQEKEDHVKGHHKESYDPECRTSYKKLAQSHYNQCQGEKNWGLGQRLA